MDWLIRSPPFLPRNNVLSHEIRLVIIICIYVEVSSESIYCTNLCYTFSLLNHRNKRKWCLWVRDSLCNIRFTVRSCLWKRKFLYIVHCVWLEMNVHKTRKFCERKILLLFFPVQLLWVSVKRKTSLWMWKVQNEECWSYYQHIELNISVEMLVWYTWMAYIFFYYRFIFLLNSHWSYDTVYPKHQIVLDEIQKMYI